MEVIKFVEKIVINKNADIIFDYTQDYDNRLTWDTFLKKAELIEGAIKADIRCKSLLRCSKWAWNGDGIYNFQ